MSASPQHPDSPDSAKVTTNRTPSVQRDRPTPSPIDFAFLNFSHPSDAKDSRARRTVRSHVTRQQHQREQQAAAAARRTRSFPQAAEPSASRRPPRLVTHQSISTPEEVYSTTTTTTAAASPIHSTRSAPGSSVTSTAPSPLHSPSSLAGSGNLDHPYDAYPTEWSPAISSIMDNYLTSLSTSNPELDQHNRSSSLIRNVWLPFVLGNRTLLHAVLLLATCYQQTRNPQLTAAIDTYALRGMALRGINEGLQDPNRSLSDEIVAAVLNVAVYEALAHNHEVFGTHMRGLQKLVSIRGGLDMLGLDGLLARMILWGDSNASYLAGSDHFFPRTAYPSIAHHPPPNPSQFGTRQSPQPR